MAINTRPLLVAALTMTAGLATAGQHGESFSTCGTNAHGEPRQLAGVGIIPADALEYRLTDEHIAALSEPQRKLLKEFERLVYTEDEMAPHVCMHPDTDPKVAEAFELFLNDLWFANSPNSFILSNRWTSTATDGGGLGQGDPTTLRYSFIPDGTNIVGEGSSNLHSFFDGRIGAGNWEPLFQQALDAWGDLSGLTYVYEPNDDGVNLSSGGNPGIIGVRGDVRIGANFIDGNSGVLAYNYFPNGGDMVIDSGDGSFYGSSSNNYIRLRNVVTHEAGHGIGLAHVESDSNRFLMEPFIDISFSGPQIDDIRGAQRGYGDMDENNNNINQASPLQDLTLGGGGFVGGNFKIITFRSTDDNSDFDYYSVPTGEPVTMNVQLTPQGGTYQITGQGGGGGGSFFNANAVSNLAFSVRDANSNIIVDVDDTGAGLSEFASVELPDPGQYYIVVDGGSTNGTQLFSLTVTFATLEVEEECPADFTGEGSLNFLDVSAFLTAFGNQDSSADFVADGNYNFLDVSAFLTAFSEGCP
ncbi:MMP24 [Symbiodinium sp. CCMP2592]|nr:MMP24 [Symbiodinium sp. CCMP2592]